MNTYKVELTQGSTICCCVIEASSKDDVRRMVGTIANLFDRLVAIEITEVKEYQVTWTQHNICTVFAASETEAFETVAEYAEDHDTGEDCDHYEIMELDAASMDGKNINERLKNLQSKRQTDMETLLDQMPKSTAGDYLPRDARPEIEVSDLMIFLYNTDEFHYEVLSDD